MNVHQINNAFKKYGEAVIRHRIIVLLTFIIITIAAVFGLKQFRTHSDFERYFMEDDPMILKTEVFKETFGNDNFVAILLKTDNIFAPEHLRLMRQMSDELRDSLSYIDKATSIVNLEFMHNEDGMISIDQLVPDTITDNPQQGAEIRKLLFSKPEIAKKLVSKDANEAWILVKLRPFPEGQDRKINPSLTTGIEVDKVITKAIYAPLHPQATGMPYVEFAKSSFFKKEMSKVMGVAILISFIILILVTRSFRGVLIPILTSIISNIFTFGLLGYLNYQPDPGMMMIPILMSFAIPIAYNIHVYAFFKRMMQEHGHRKQAVIDTFEEVGWPVLFSAITTIAALLSFLAIPVEPLHFVGFSTALSILSAFIIISILFPILMSFGKDTDPLKLKKDGETNADKFMGRFGESVLHHKRLIVSCFTIITVIMLIGATRISAAFDVENTMGHKVQYVNSLLDIARSELGSLYSYDMMIDLPNEGDAKDPQMLQKLQQLEQYTQTLPLTKKTSSVLDIIKELNRTLQDGKQEHYTIPQTPEEVAQLLLLYENAGGSEAEYWVDYDYKKLRLMVELNDYNSAEAEKELQQIQNKAEEIFPHSEVQVVGTLPQFTTMMQYVVRGQISSFFISLGIIALLLIIVFRSVKIGIVGMIPNMLPGIFVAGVMGWARIPLDMMTATIIPIILGISVDDTIHFINHAHLEFNRTRNYKQTVIRTFRVTGIAIIMSTVIICSNFAVYGISIALSVIRIGLLSVLGLTVALLVDLCITPLLLRRFKLFGPEVADQNEELPSTH